MTGYEKFVDEVRRSAGPITREQADLVAVSYLETLREHFSGDRANSLASHLPEELARRMEESGGGEEFSVWEFYERLAQRASIAPEMATR